MYTAPTHLITLCIASISTCQKTKSLSDRQRYIVKLYVSAIILLLRTMTITEMKLSAQLSPTNLGDGKTNVFLWVRGVKHTSTLLYVALIDIANCQR